MFSKQNRAKTKKKKSFTILRISSRVMHSNSNPNYYYLMTISESIQY